MNYDLSECGVQSIRQMDTNSLMRLLDRAGAMVKDAPLQLDRTRAGKAIERINRELLRRTPDRPLLQTESRHSWRAEL